MLPRSEGSVVTGVLTRGQWRLHGVLGVFVVTAVATSFPTTIHAVQVAHRALGKLSLLVGLAFVIWHLRSALRTRHGAAILTGVVLVLLALVVVVTGILLPEGDDGGPESGPRGAHGLAALLAPLVYLGHRRLGVVKPGALPWVIALASLAACAWTAMSLRVK
jgi:hypothetical protein